MANDVDLQRVTGVSAEVLTQSFIQQQLPTAEIPNSDGSAIRWVEFIVKFRDVVHQQQFLSDKLELSFPHDPGGPDHTLSNFDGSAIRWVEFTMKF